MRNMKEGKTAGNGVVKGNKNYEKKTISKKGTKEGQEKGGEHRGREGRV